MRAGWFPDACMTLALAIRSKPLPAQGLWSYPFRCCASSVVVMQLLALKASLDPMSSGEIHHHTVRACPQLQSGFFSPAALCELNAFRECGVCVPQLRAVLD